MNPLFARRSIDRATALTFAPLAWLKLQYFCHSGDTEIGGFGITRPKNLLYVEEFRTVRQAVTPMTVRFDDSAVADFFDESVDQGLVPAQFGRIWLHTHPGESAIPSGTDEDTFARAFGGCDWSVMFILSRTGQTYARMAFSAGPGGQMMLPVEVDWAAWPRAVSTSDQLLATCAEQCRNEFAANIVPEQVLMHSAASCSSANSPSGDHWTAFMSEWLGQYQLAEFESYEDNLHEPIS
jgi:proteasome lid subunit RPN8/RPN11